MEIFLRIGPACLCIQWDSNGIDNIVKNMFSPWLVSSGNPSQVWKISPLDSGYSLETPLRSVRCSSEKMLAAHIEYGLTLYALDMYSQNLLLHASCVDLRGNGVLFVGPHGMGKTTLALAAISSGFRALTDDVTIVGNGHTQVLGFPRPFKVCADIWDLQPRVIPSDCPFFKVSPETTYLYFYLPDGRYYAEKTNLKYIVFPVRNAKAPSIRELGETESLGKLMEQGFNLYQKKNGRVDELLDLLRKTRSFEIGYHSNSDMLEKVRELLEVQ